MLSRNSPVISPPVPDHDKDLPRMAGAMLPQLMVLSSEAAGCGEILRLESEAEESNGAGKSPRQKPHSFSI